MNRLLVSILLSVIILSGCEIKKSKLSQKDVTFYGTGKVSRYQQLDDDTLEALQPLFFAEIFITEGGNVNDAKVILPNAQESTIELLFRHSESDEIGDVMYHSEMLESYETLEEKYPMGAYRFNFETSEGRVLNSVVSYRNKSFPDHPVIMFYQDDMRIGINEVDSAKELIIKWPEFSAGQSDPNNILDDPIFVAIDSCIMEDIIHSGRPFEKNGYLNYQAREYKVSPNKLEPGQTYAMYVEHAIFTDTQNDFGMPGFATLASSTYMDFQTLGMTDPNYCMRNSK